MRPPSNRRLDYYPILAYFGFWLQGALIGALITGEPKLIMLGLVTVPALLALLIAVIKIRGQSREERERPRAVP